MSRGISPQVAASLDTRIVDPPLELIGPCPGAAMFSVSKEIVVSVFIDNEVSISLSTTIYAFIDFTTSIVCLACLLVMWSSATIRK